MFWRANSVVLAVFGWSASMEIQHSCDDSMERFRRNQMKKRRAKTTNNTHSSYIISGTFCIFKIKDGVWLFFLRSELLVLVCVYECMKPMSCVVLCCVALHVIHSLYSSVHFYYQSIY